MIYLRKQIMMIENKIYFNKKQVKIFLLKIRQLICSIIIKFPINNSQIIRTIQINKGNSKIALIILTVKEIIYLNKIN